MAKTPPTYPRTIYTLTRNFNVRKVTLVKPFSQWSLSSGYTARGIFYAEANIYPTPAAAIKAGRSKINRRLKNIAAAQSEIAKQIDALDKAEKESK